MRPITDFEPGNVLKNRDVASDVLRNIQAEELLHAGTLRRLHTSYEAYSGLLPVDKELFTGKERYTGLDGFREIVAILAQNGIELGYQTEREAFIEVYRFMVTRHVLNSIHWADAAHDSLFQLTFPQPGMIPAEAVLEYAQAATEDDRARVVAAYQEKTNPHDGNQKLNKPWYLDDDGHLEVLKGSQHKYPPCALIFEQTTQNCFAFCTYCFRHAQVRGDEDMFLQEDVQQLHDYLRCHTEVTDILITGGDGGYITYDRLRQYALPLIEDAALYHVKTLRIGSRLLTFNPEYVLSDRFNKHLELMRHLHRNGVQVLWMSHFSTPRELLNPFTIAAINRLRAHGVTLKSQSPIMKHISLFTDQQGKTDVDRSAQNWIDLGNIFATLGVGFHSMYCARPTGEHHYFTAPLADINKVFSKVYKTLASVNRPSRYITMTSSAGKISLIGTIELEGEKLFALKFNEGRNMDWMDTIYLAKYDEQENTIAKLKPYKGAKHFFELELEEIEKDLEDKLLAAMQYEKQGQL